VVESVEVETGVRRSTTSEAKSALLPRTVTPSLGCASNWMAISATLAASVNDRGVVEMDVASAPLDW
jgi:hypothetical protein